RTDRCGHFFRTDAFTWSLRPALATGSAEVFRDIRARHSVYKLEPRRRGFDAVVSVDSRRHVSGQTASLVCMGEAPECPGHRLWTVDARRRTRRNEYDRGDIARGG